MPPLFLHLLSGQELSASARVRLEKPFSVGSLSGVIQRRGQRFYGKVLGNVKGTGNIFEGELELEKPVPPTMFVFSGYIRTGEFVLSTNSDYRKFVHK
jgi:hypothetical protein